MPPPDDPSAPHATSGSSRAAVGRASRAGSRARAALLAATAVALGWVLHDLATFVTSGRRALALEILPGSAVALAIAALLGLVVGLRPRVLLPALLALAAAASVVPHLVALPLAHAQLWLPRALFAGTLLATGVFLGARALGRGTLQLGVAAGLAASLAMGCYLQGWMRGSTAAAVGAGLGLVTLLVRRPRLGAALGLLCALAPLGYLAWRDRDWPSPDRPDLAPPAVPATGPPNLLLVVLDTVRADHLASWGYARDTMPGLERFGRERCVRYAQARSATSWTLPSHATLFTGLAPAEHGATHPRSDQGRIYPGYPLREDVPTLAEVLRDDGYRTAAIVANSYALRTQLKLDRGFEHYDPRPGAGVLDYFPLAQLSGHDLFVGHFNYRDARTITDEALDWLDRLPSGQSFFLALNYLDAHWPYIAPAPWSNAFSDERPVDPLDPRPELRPLLYDRELAWLDSQLTRLLDGLEQRGLLENTVVVVTSDHGEAFGEHGFWMHDWTLYDETIHVPLFVKPLGPPAPRVETRPVTGAEVPGIALAALGVPTPPGPLAGDGGGATFPTGPRAVLAEWYDLDGAGLRAVSPPGKHRPVPADVLERMRTTHRDLVAWLEGRRKVIVASTGEVQAFDLEADPDEHVPLELSAEERAKWVQRARDWWAAHPPQVPTTTATDEELEEWRKQGRSIGYAGGDGG